MGELLLDRHDVEASGAGARAATRRTSPGARRRRCVAQLSASASRIRLTAPRVVAPPSQALTNPEPPPRVGGGSGPTSSRFCMATKTLEGCMLGIHRSSAPWVCEHNGVW